MRRSAKEIAARTVKTAQTSGIVGALTDTRLKAAAPIDDTLNALTDLLGLHLGEVDVWVTGVRCHRPALVL